MSPRAAVDVGSNSVRLLIHGDEGQRLLRRMEITRLARDVDATGRLNDATLGNTLAVIGEFRRLWQDHGVDDQVRIAATSAVRDAADKQRFFDGVRNAAGVDAEVLTGAEEAQLAFAGASGAVEVAKPTVVLDIGGGSTELIVGDTVGAVVASVSMQMGCVRMTERHLRGDPPAPASLAALCADIDRQLDDAWEALRSSGADLARIRSLVAVAGTATTLGALHLGLDEYEEARIHGCRIPAADLHHLTERLTRMTSAQRAELGPMQPGREDVIHAGAVILSRVVLRLAIDEIVISEADGLDGLVASLA